MRFTIAADGSQCTIHAAAPELAEQLGAIIRNVTARPDLVLSSIDLMTESERQTLLRTWNDTDRPVPDACIHELIAAQAAATPDATALVYQGRRMSYRELDDRTNRLARHLTSLGVGPDVPVGIFLQRSFSMMEAVLATLNSARPDVTRPRGRLVGRGLVTGRDRIRR